MNDLKKYIREVPDFPKPGINFYDITTLLQDARGLRETVDRFCWCFLDHQVDKVVGMESRGFLFAPVLACSLNAGFVPVRKPGKLPAKTVRHSYELEYGSDTLEMHEDAIRPGERVLIVDDLLATGGTAAATVELVRGVGGEIAGLGFVIELGFLPGRQKLAGHEVVSLITY
ncbi:MAG: adenine phosphoribosyltransferase [Acidobacteria bacterium]|nr:MAG: adenine phosphoribosyltransferase [Acidobacteriota bacterium]REK04324.1 MAG: adenine phosphoribosyltransferase [Acidobacteriota bacterium]